MTTVWNQSGTANQKKLSIRALARVAWQLQAAATSATAYFIAPFNTKAKDSPERRIPKGRLTLE